MRVLIACEQSGVVRRSFRALGHDAWSCDILPAADNSEFHFQRFIEDIIPQAQWNLMIAHPPCTYLSSSGLHWNNKRPERAIQTEHALDFVRFLMNAPVPRIALENPRGCIGSRIRKADQVIQPYQFGDDASKETHLWLKGLLPLTIDPANYIKPRMVDGKPRWANQTDSGQNKLGPSEHRAKVRSVTYQGIADAMAQSWSV